MPDYTNIPKKSEIIEDLQDRMSFIKRGITFETLKSDPTKAFIDNQDFDGLIDDEGFLMEDASIDYNDYIAFTMLGYSFEDGIENVINDIKLDVMNLEMHPEFYALPNNIIEFQTALKKIDMTNFDIELFVKAVKDIDFDNLEIAKPNVKKAFVKPKQRKNSLKLT